MKNLAPGIKQRFKEQLTELATKYTLLESYSEPLTTNEIVWKGCLKHKSQ